MRRFIPWWLGLALIGWLPGPAMTAPAAPVKFSDRLNAKFHHDRCLQCHQFNSRSHNGRGFGSHRSRYLCAQCHTQALTGLPSGDWMAPEEKMDYTHMDARATCELIKRNTGSGNLREKMAHHLLQDVRVRWAIENGNTPGGQREKVPGDYAEWTREVNAWLDSGMRCE